MVIMIRVATLVLILAFYDGAFSFDSSNILFVIVSQSEPYHASVATRLKQDIENQILEIEEEHPIVHITHEDFPIPGAWTIVPLLSPIVDKYRYSDVRWVVFLEPHTAVRCRLLIDALKAADKKKDVMWIGYPLSDQEPTIIHHYHFFNDGDLEEEGGFVYPYFASGFAMRMELIATLLSQIASGSSWEGEFSIDPAHELALVVFGNDSRHHGPLLTPDLSFCVVAREDCATYPRQFDKCGSAIPEESIFFAVKTWSGYHETRAKVVKKTWGKHVTNLRFYSDKADPFLPSVETGVPNTKSGHCAKTVAILKMAVREAETMPHVKWIFLADDDTILGVQRLCEVLSCYRGGDDDYTVLGERYGYGYLKETAVKGFDFITGGGGTALSLGAARALSACACGASEPDDMVLGACARHERLALTHSPLFHQNRPQDYPVERIARDRPLSFHRHSAEPLRVYAAWFQHDDLPIRLRRRDEL